MMSSVLRGRYATLLTCFGVAITVSAISSPAEARYRHFRHHVGGGYNPPYAAMVVDANSGRVLYAKNENELRHPASLTKVMTLYLLFEQLEKGRFNMDSQLKVSAHASNQQPSKLGLDAGDTIGVEDAIKAIVTRSANDVAVAIGENIAGDESTFAEQMTHKAHQLGMSRTNFENASGLPNQDQVTTARDLTILGRAIQDRFPKYYRYFSTHHFDYAGSTIGNHNKLLGRVEGVDGIKTGYTTASGFNLLSSMKRDGHSLVASVLGGKSGRERDAIMTSLLEDHIDEAAGRRTVAAIGEKPSGEPIKIATNEPTKLVPADVKPTAKPTVLANNDEEEEDTAPVAKPAVAAAPVAKPMQVGLLTPVTPDLPKARPAVLSATPKAVPAEDAKPAVTAAAKPVPLDGSTKARPLVAMAAATPPAPVMRWVAGPQGVDPKKLDGKAAPKMALAYAQDNTPTATVIPRPRPVAESSTVAKVAAVEPAAPAHTGWMIQIGAADDVAKANALLSRAKTESKGALASASPFTEKVQKGEQTLYRARFAGLEADEATTACKRLKQSGFACFPTKN